MKTPKKKNLYGNFKLIAPNGDFCSFCPERRRKWYLKKGLATEIDKNTIQLKFTPKGKNPNWDLFNSSVKENICVVCGDDETLTSHHIVPYCFRQHLPKLFKNSNCHDVLICCFNCHSFYELHASKFKIELFEKYNVELDATWMEIRNVIRCIGNDAKSLLQYGDKMPPDRKQFLEDKIKLFCLEEEITPNLLKELLKLNAADSALMDELKETKSKFLMKNVQSLVEIQDFIFLWRRHFVETMQPKYLPQYWSVERPLLIEILRQDNMDSVSHDLNLQ